MNDRKQKKETTRFLFYKMKMNLDAAKIAAHGALSSGKDLSTYENLNNPFRALTDALIGEVVSIKHLGIRL